MNLRWVRVAALSTIGCGPSAPAEPVDRTWDGEFLLDQIVIDCEGSQGWTYDVTTQGWGNVISLDIAVREYGVLTWREHHELPEIEYGDDWARHFLSLEQVFSDEDYADSSSTWIACEAKTYVTYGFGAWRQDGDMQECAAWGIDPEGEFPDCINWGETGH